MGAIYALCAITGVLSIFIVYLENKGVFTMKYIMKAVSSLCFVLVGILCLMQSGMAVDHDLGVNENWKMLVIAALVLGMLGDIFLSSENIVGTDYKGLGSLNIAGGAFFAFGHIAYVVWLIGFTETFNYWTLFALAAVPLILFILDKVKIFKAGKMLLPVMLYGAFLGLMLASSVNAYLELQLYPIADYILAGGILFVISDFFLAYYNFGHKQQTYVKYIYMPAYYVAQLMFALTLLY